jgi:hypothetical protein
MSKPTRRRGAQPGNSNALKRGLYRNKPARGLQARGGQPFNLNRLVHGDYSSLLSPSTSVPAKSGRPKTIRPLLPDLTFSGLLGKDAWLAQGTQPVQAPLRPGSLADFLTLLNLQLVELLDDPLCSPGEIARLLHRMNGLVESLLRDLSENQPTDLNNPERTLPP